ncbi:MAG: hypothetical protein GXO02_03635 [Epsilonproteobacteria bacterium]|nr:hypothetical protein [Campylobacterota bacterium]
MKRLKLLSLLVISALIVGGCGFDVKKVVPEFLKSSPGISAKFAIRKISKRAIDVRRDGVTFDDGTFVTREGEGPFKLPLGYYFVNKSSSKYIAAAQSGKFKIFDSSGEEIVSGKVPLAIISASIIANQMVYVLENNTIGVYSLSAKKVIASKTLKPAYAIDTRVANPIFFKGFAIIPTLDGKLLMINPEHPDLIRGVDLAGGAIFSNIIYLDTIEGRIIAASLNMVLSIAPGALEKYKAQVADVTTSSNRVFLLTMDGKTIKMTPALREVIKRKFKYADFTNIAYLDGKVFAFARSGALVVLDSNLLKYKIYAVGEARDYSFVAHDKLYIDDRVVDLNKLSYE